MKNEEDAFKVIFESIMEEFIHQHLKTISYHIAMHAEKTINDYQFKSTTILPQIHRDIAYSLECFEKDLLNCQFLLKSSKTKKGACKNLS